MSDLFTFLDHMNKEDYDYVDRMTDEEVKKISPFVLLGFSQGAQQNTGLHVFLSNVYCNEYVFPLSKHPRLLLKMFMVANGGIDNTRYKFKKPPNTDKKTKIKHLARYYEIGYNEARDYLEILDDEEIERICQIFDQ